MTTLSELESAAPVPALPELEAVLSSRSELRSSSCRGSPSLYRLAPVASRPLEETLFALPEARQNTHVALRARGSSCRAPEARAALARSQLEENFPVASAELEEAPVALAELEAAPWRALRAKSAASSSRLPARCSSCRAPALEASFVALELGQLAVADSQAKKKLLFRAPELEQLLSALRAREGQLLSRFAELEEAPVARPELEEEVPVDPELAAPEAVPVRSRAKRSSVGVPAEETPVALSIREELLPLPSAHLLSRARAEEAPFRAPELEKLLSSLTRAREAAPVAPRLEGRVLSRSRARGSVALVRRAPELERSSSVPSPELEGSSCRAPELEEAPVVLRARRQAPNDRLLELSSQLTELKAEAACAADPELERQLPVALPSVEQLLIALPELEALYSITVALTELEQLCRAPEQISYCRAAELDEQLLSRLPLEAALSRLPS
nr:uncharacterized protein LOC113810677 [Penaeus vannamei]